MPSPAGTIADHESAPSRGRLAIGYVVTAVVMSFAVVVYDAAEHFLQLYTDNIRWAALVFWNDVQLGSMFATALLVVWLPTAWLPVWLTLAACRRLSVPRLVGCVAAGFVTMVFCKLVRAIVLPSLELDWMDAVAELLRMWTIGGLGALVFWAICFRPRARSDAQIAKAVAEL